MFFKSPKGIDVYINNDFAKRQDLKINRVVNHKFDNLDIVDGDEGYGKSNKAAEMCAYYHAKTGRPLNINNVFFLIDDLMKFATTTEKQIIWWDEAALGGLSTEGYTKVQLKLLKLLMVARKKQHFYIFCIPKFYKLKEAIVDRAIGLTHVYSPDNITRGTFTYYTKEKLEELYNLWKETRKKHYRTVDYTMGTFKDVLRDVIDEEAYERKKDAAILTIGSNDADMDVRIKKLNTKIQELKYIIANIPDKIKISQTELSKKIGISRKTLQDWLKLNNNSIKIDTSIDFDTASRLSFTNESAQKGDDVEADEIDSI
jgi:DNA-binding transcriptional regulator YiaG